ncbi:unnamed protein product [Aphis gossypii]|uniref:Uncharacterized protein n=1 Tax=Aphis gossypii TaxID=80765 RepID=A0A9P0IMJ9_APHGO|nr:unnamed protein product [Aphis gossypii]
MCIYTFYTRLTLCLRYAVGITRDKWRRRRKRTTMMRTQRKKIVYTIIITILYYIRENVPPRTELSSPRLDSRTNDRTAAYYSYIWYYIYDVNNNNIASDVSRGATFFFYSYTIALQSHKGIEAYIFNIIIMCGEYRKYFHCALL